MNKKSSTLPKNMILNWLYSTDMHVSLDKLGKWLEQTTQGKYKIVNTEKHNNIYRDCA